MSDPVQLALITAVSTVLLAIVSACAGRIVRGPVPVPLVEPKQLHTSIPAS